MIIDWLIFALAGGDAGGCQSRARTAPCRAQLGLLAVSGPTIYAALTGRVLGVFNNASTVRGMGAVDYEFTAPCSAVSANCMFPLEPATLETV